MSKEIKHYSTSVLKQFAEILIYHFSYEIKVSFYVFKFKSKIGYLYYEKCNYFLLTTIMMQLTSKNILMNTCMKFKK